MSSRYLTSEQDVRLRRWEAWNKRYFIFAFFSLVIVLVFSSQLGLSSGDSWGPLGLLIAALVTPASCVSRLRAKDWLAGQADGPGPMQGLWHLP